MKTDILRHTEIFIFLALVFSIYTAILLKDKANLTKEGQDLGVCIDDWEKVIDSLLYVTNMQDSTNRIDRIHIETLVNENKNLKDSLAKRMNNTPPHIEISGTSSYYFDSGKAKILYPFQNYLKTKVVPKLKYDLANCKNCNSIYIIGHTDNQKVKSQNVNKKFDQQLINSIKTENSKIDFAFNSNTDLGIQRALAVCLFLKKQKGLEQIKYWFPYSGGPLIDSETSLLSTSLDASNSVKNRKKRRIELWLYAYNSN